MFEIQNRNWKVIQEHCEILKRNILVLRDCDQLLFSQQQVNDKFDPLSILLAVIFANNKTY